MTYRIKTLKVFTLLVAPLLMQLTGCAEDAQTPESVESVNLAGTWQIRLDPDDVGIKQNWQNQTFEEELQLPGALQEHGYGNIPGPDTKWYGNAEWAGKGGLNGWGPEWLKPGTATHNNV